MDGKKINIYDRDEKLVKSFEGDENVDAEVAVVDGLLFRDQDGEGELEFTPLSTDPGFLIEWKRYSDKAEYEIGKWLVEAA